MPRWSVGENVPLVTVPTGVSPSRISQPGRGTARSSSMRRATSLRAGPSARVRAIASEPT